MHLKGLHYEALPELIAIRAIRALHSRSLVLTDVLPTEDMGGLEEAARFERLEARVKETSMSTSTSTMTSLLVSEILSLMLSGRPIREAKLVARRGR